MKRYRGERRIALIIDDKEQNLVMLQEILKNRYEIRKAMNGVEAIHVITEEKDKIAILLLDMIMPVMSGKGVLEYLKKEKLDQVLPVIVVTADKSMDTLCTEYDYGVAEVLQKPISPTGVLKKVEKVDLLYTYERDQEQVISYVMCQLQEVYKRLRVDHHGTPLPWEEVDRKIGHYVAMKYPKDYRRIKKSMQCSQILARQLLSSYPQYAVRHDDLSDIQSATMLRDLGKLVVPDDIFSMDKATNKEMQHIKKRPLIGCDLMEMMRKDADPKYYKCCYDVCKFHHERWDGKGYPAGIGGSKIPISAQIVGLVDVYDTVVNRKSPFNLGNHKEAVAVILQSDYKAFNPDLLDCFEMVADDFLEVVRK